MRVCVCIYIYISVYLSICIYISSLYICVLSSRMKLVIVHRCQFCANDQSSNEKDELLVWGC